jgi:hypothetical protein
MENSYKKEIERKIVNGICLHNDCEEQRQKEEFYCKNHVKWYADNNTKCIKPGCSHAHKEGQTWCIYHANKYNLKESKIKHLKRGE